VRKAETPGAAAAAQTALPSAISPRPSAGLPPSRSQAPPLPPRAPRRFRPFIAVGGDRFLAPEAARPAGRRPPHRPRLRAFPPRGSPLPTAYPGAAAAPCRRAAAPASRCHEARQVSGWRRIAGARLPRRQGSPRANGHLAGPLPQPWPLGCPHGGRAGPRGPALPYRRLSSGLAQCRPPARGLSGLLGTATLSGGSPSSILLESPS